MVVTSRVHRAGTAEFQFKNAIMTLAAEDAILVPDDPQRAINISAEVRAAISRIKYYRPKSPRPTHSRVTKTPPHKWCSGRRKKLEEA